MGTPKKATPMMEATVSDFDAPRARTDDPQPADIHDEREADLAVRAQAGLLRNSAVMASGSIVSRITGVLRNISLTAAIGLTISADAFALGNSLPDIVYVLVIGGALNAVFVPQLVRRMKDDADGGKAYTDSLLSLTGVLLLIVTVTSVLLAPLIVSLYATSTYSSEQVGLAVAFARYCLPQIFFFGLYAMLSQVLNSRGRFGMPMFAPIFNNLVAIATYVSFILIFGTAADDGLIDATQAMWLGVGTTLGIAAQALILVPVMLRSGYRFSFSRQWRGMGLGKAGRLAGWTIGLVAVTQAAFIVISRLATQANVNASEVGAPPAGLFTYTNAYLVFMIPHGIVTVSIVTAQLPGLSRLVHAGQRRAAGLDIGHTMRLVALVIAPLATALTLAAQPLANLLFNYGAASADQASQLGTVISIFMLGLLPFTLFYVLQRGWYANEDTRTPFLFSVLMNGVLVALAIPLFARAAPGPNQVSALAIAYSTACLVTFLVAWPTLRRSYGFLDSRATLWALVRIGAAVAAAIVAVALLHRFVLPPFSLDDGKAAALISLIVISAVVAAAYGIVAWLLRIPEMHEITGWVTGAVRRVLPSR
jgi:putative peptidoglycan lipid II flippase